MSIRKEIIISLILLISSACLIYSSKNILAEINFTQKLKGKILLQVEENGEAWYINPNDNKRYFLGRPDDAFILMKILSIGISNENIKKIAIAEANFEGDDNDNDGLSNAIEDSFGTDKNNRDTDDDGYNDYEEILNNYNALGQGKINIDNIFASNQAGKILIQAEQNGEAWYVNPDNLKRYYLGRPKDAFNLMRDLGLGITNDDLARIEENIYNPEYTSQNIEKKYTMEIDNDLRQYNDPAIKYSINYPQGWKIVKYQENPYATHLTDAVVNFMDENKATITIHYWEFDDPIENLDFFRNIQKEDAVTLLNQDAVINGLKTLQKAYKHKLTYQKTSYIELNSGNFLQIDLITPKKTQYYENIYDNLVNSLQIPYPTCNTCQ